MKRIGLSIAENLSSQGLSGRDSDEIDRLLTEYKASVLKSTIKAKGRENFELKDDVKDDEGKLLLSKGAPKNDSELRIYLGKLLSMNLEHPIEYYIGVINPEEVAKLHNKMVDIAASLSENGVIENFDEMKKVIEEVVSCLSNDIILLNRMTVLESEYVSGFGESLLVAVLSTAIGEKHSYDFDKKVCVFTAGLLHHIGEIPLYSLFNKGRIKNEKLPYDDIARIRNHPITGYLILSGSDEIPVEIRDAVLRHHLFLDGSGYPRNLKLTEKDDLAKLICLTSSFVTMQTRGRKKMEQVLRLLDIYSRTKTRTGEKIAPLYDREFYMALLSLDPRKMILRGYENDDKYARDYSCEDIMRLHNSYVFFKKRNEELHKLAETIESFISNNSIPSEAESNVDVLFGYISKLRNLTSDAKEFTGMSELKKIPNALPELMLDAEVIRMELKGYVGGLEETFSNLTPLFEKDQDSWILKKAMQFTTRIRNNLPNSLLDKCCGSSPVS
ncbi:MAG: HD domain-containing phosphohydrolase [Pseudomonadota bacterium]